MCGLLFVLCEDDWTIVHQSSFLEILGKDFYYKQKSDTLARIGSDHALYQENKVMKVTIVVKGLTQNASAFNRSCITIQFFSCLKNFPV